MIVGPKGSLSSNISYYNLGLIDFTNSSTFFILTVNDWRTSLFFLFISMPSPVTPIITFSEEAKTL